MAVTTVVMADLADRTTMDPSVKAGNETLRSKDLVAQPNKSEDTNASVATQELNIITNDTAQDCEAASEGADGLSTATGEFKASSDDNTAHLGIGPATACGDGESAPHDVGNDPDELVKKKKKKNKGKGNKRKGGLVGHKKASGFEGESSSQVTTVLPSNRVAEFYADPPVSPAEAVEEKELYSK